MSLEGSFHFTPTHSPLHGQFTAELTESLTFSPVLCRQVQDKETQASGRKGEDGTTGQEPWIGVVPVEIEDSKASTGNQESFANTMVNKVRNPV